jgi:uncharacterized Zn finger protein
MDNSKELISITLTKEQWEEICQWYLIIDSEYNLKDREHEAANKIANTLIEKYGYFN